MELINIKNNQAVTTSLMVADAFGKHHKNVIQAIENLLAKDNELKNELVAMFHKGNYVDVKGEKRPMYYMNRDGFSLLVMGFTGKKALEWKLKYIEAFNQMESLLNFKRADIQIQKHSMNFLNDNLQMPTSKDFIKANTIANKCVSTLNGYDKMVKKDDMTPQMLEQREPILEDVVQIMAFKEKYNLDMSVSDAVYKKYAK